jgi:hypothetical protein
VKQDQGHAHPDWGGGQRRYAKRGAPGEHKSTKPQFKKIEAVHEQISIAKEIINRFSRHPMIEPPNPQFRVDGARHFLEYRRLLAPDRAERGANLTIEVHELEMIGVGDRERANTQPSERQQVHATDAAHASDRHPFGPKRELFKVSDKSEIAAERQITRESTVAL